MSTQISKEEFLGFNPKYLKKYELNAMILSLSKELVRRDKLNQKKLAKLQKREKQSGAKSKQTKSNFKPETKKYSLLIQDDDDEDVIFEGTFSELKSEINDKLSSGVWSDDTDIEETLASFNKPFQLRKWLKEFCAENEITTQFKFRVAKRSE